MFSIRLFSGSYWGTACILQIREKQAHKGKASFWLNAGENRIDLFIIPSTDPPTSYHSLIAEGGRVNLRYNEYVAFHSDLTYPEYLSHIGVFEEKRKYGSFICYSAAIV